MVRVKSRALREQAYRNSIPSIPGKYKIGVEQASGVIEASIAGQDLYEQRMRDQQVLSRREKGLRRVTDAEWKAAAIGKGSQRIASGMEAAASKQAANYEPIAQALEAVTLPPRTADAMANIDNRVKPIVQAAINASPKNK